MLKVLGEKGKREILRVLSSELLPEGHPVDRDSLVVVFSGGWGWRNGAGE